MAKWWRNVFGGIGVNPESMGINKQSISDFFLGSPAKRENVSMLMDEQIPLYEQLQRAAMERGAGGAFGTAADYYRDLMGNDSADMQAFTAPALRQYAQDIVPGLSEQFAGMGAGGLSSSGFRNAQVQGATDLAERLGALRANLRQQGAQGLMNLGQTGLGSFSTNMETQPGSSGLLGALAPVAGAAIGTAFGGPAGGAMGYGMGQGVSSAMSPYGSANPRASAW